MNNIFSSEYLVFSKNERIGQGSPPANVDPEGWAYGLHLTSGKWVWNIELQDDDDGDDADDDW
eukprot:4559578-Karenia_brevis.AAC.1